jgi:Protein of unknown function (DUF3085)
VQRIVEHSLAAPEQSKMLVDFDNNTGDGIYSEVEASSVVLVHDQGVYLMSNGKPRDLIKKPSRNGKVMTDASFVAYAHGCNPDKGAGKRRRAISSAVMTSARRCRGQSKLPTPSRLARRRSSSR